MSDSQTDDSQPDNHDALINEYPVVMYTTKFCPFCIGAKQLLTEKGISFHEIPVDFDPQLRKLMSAKANGLTSVPQIWINQKHVGGYDQLSHLDTLGGLDLDLS